VPPIHAPSLTLRGGEWITSPPIWLQIRQIVVPPDGELTELGPGEREAIALAKAFRADELVIDEKAWRREAERRKLRLFGGLLVLVVPAKRGG
jgi:predicted nucleic acid-binding protein